VSDIAPAKTADVSENKIAVNTFSGNRISIRVSPNGYFIALFLATFFSGFLVYLEIDWAAIALLIAGWLFLPILLWSDRIEFNGKRLFRTGVLPNLWAFINNSRSHLKLTEIEQVETQAIRALKRGGNVFYRYRTSIRGKDAHFAFASGGEDYRRMIRQIFPCLSDNILDNRSVELRDYLAEPKETLMKAEFAHIPSAEVLENSFGEDNFRRMKRKDIIVGTEEIEKADYLHRLGNELRLSGYLLQALEAFRRALTLNPRDARLLFDFARCLNSFAGSEKNEKLKRKSIAVLRLAEKHAESDGELLERLGESLFQFGDYRRAKIVFQKAQDKAHKSFRSVRGLAEIALREGKIAHVILHFAAANRLAETPALRRWTRNESEYFSRLNADSDYMELEINRVNLLDTLESSKKTTLKIALFGFPFILLGVVSEENTVANVGWAISSVALLIWIGLILSQKLLSARIPFEMLEDEE
jgi:tetratricopeptide (TPR) repeat protein